MNEPLFDVIYLGETLPECNLERALKAIALLTHTNTEQAKGYLSKANVCLLEGASAANAEAVQGTLHELGLKCRRQPTAIGKTNFEIVPIDPIEDQPRVSTCPSCQVSVPQVPGMPALDACPSCGAVFAKCAVVASDKNKDGAPRPTPHSPPAGAARIDKSTTGSDTASRRPFLELITDAVEREFDMADAARLRMLLLGAGTLLFFLGIVVGAGGSYLFVVDQPKPTRTTVEVPVSESTIPDHGPETPSPD